MILKDLKKNSKRLLKKNFRTLAIVSIFMSFFIGEYIISNDGFRNFQIVGEVIQDQKEDKLITNFFEKSSGNLINEYVDKIIYNFISGNTSERINQYNDNHNISKGVFFAVFNLITNGQIQFQNFVNSIGKYSDTVSTENLMVILGSSIALILQILVLNPLIVGENRIFLESINYNKTKLKRISFAFKKENYLSIVKGIFRLKIYQFLWGITIIGGIIKNYSYKMVPFIIAENPKIDSKNAIKLSRDMMYGHKMEAFKMDLSFFGWFFLEYITFGLAGIFVNPYYKECFIQFYIELRNEYKQGKKEKYELLNDEILFNKELIKNKYPDYGDLSLDEIQNYPETNIKQKRTIEYQKNYSVSSLIIMFFIFSFIGWIWECFYILIEKGVLVNRGAMYGPWLPIYGFGCIAILAVAKIKQSERVLKSPGRTFFAVMILCTIIEYLTSLYLETTKGVRYWDYTGIFLNINGRVCLENSIFFGMGGCICLYFLGPFLENKIQKISHSVRVFL